jgi:hypothetical protein
MTPPSALASRLGRVAAALVFGLAVAFLLAASAGHAQPTSSDAERGDALPRTSPNATVSQTVGVTEVRLAYGRPSARGRDIFGGLVPYGEIWRTGANEATTISFSDDVRVEGQPLEAGRYSLFTVPGRDSWTVIFNRQADQWGAFNHDESQDALRVEVRPEQPPHAHEQMAFRFSRATDTSAVANLVWEDVRVPFRIMTDTPANVRAKAEAAMEDAGDWRGPYQYAAYALENDHYPEAALGWAERSIALEETFQNTALKARLLAAMERYDEARASAERAVAMAEEMGETPQGLGPLREQMADWEAR